jgi:hypothetical protein
MSRRSRTPNRHHPRRAIAAAIAGLPLLIAGCGGGGGSSVARLGGGAATAKASQSAASTPGGAGQSFSSGGVAKAAAGLVTQGSPAAALKFAACMRSHGVPGFPDPSASGATVITPGGSINPQSPQFEAAQTACAKLLRPGGAPSPAQQAQGLASALKFSACMRSHGITGFPDPTSSGGGIQLKLASSSGIDPSSPIFQAAQTACQKLLPGGGPTAVAP